MANSFRLDDHSDEAKKAMSDAIAAALTACGLKAEEYAKREINGEFGAPRRVDSSNLKNSISNAVRKSENAVYIGTNVEYAPYVHEGTYKMAPNRFLRNAVERNADEYKKIIKDATS